MDLRQIGYWRSDAEPGWPHPVALVDGGWDEKERDLVISYLQQGMPWMAYMGMSTCRICGQSNGASDFTDGVYVWPEGLAHYLREHGIRLPQEFVAHVVARVHAQPDGGVWWRAVTQADPATESERIPGTP